MNFNDLAVRVHSEQDMKDVLNYARGQGLNITADWEGMLVRYIREYPWYLLWDRWGDNEPYQERDPDECSELIDSKSLLNGLRPFNPSKHRLLL